MYLSPRPVLLFQNDAFISNGDPEAFPIYTEEDGFMDIDFTVMGGMVLDAGTVSVRKWNCCSVLFHCLT